MKIVLDTNVLIQAISSRSVHHWIWESLRREELTLCVTTDVLLEYEEVLCRNRSSELGKLVLDVIVNMPNLSRVEVYFNFGFPAADPDDQKFMDCAIASGAKFLVTQDRDFWESENKFFNWVQVVTPLELRSILHP